MIRIYTYRTFKPTSLASSMRPHKKSHLLRSTPWFLGFFLFLFSMHLQSQEKGIRVAGVVVGKDTIPYIGLPEVVIETQMSAESKRKYTEWTRLKYNVKKVYPYAIIAAARLKEYDQKLQKLKTESERKAYMKVVEKELEKEFGPELKELTINQGRILIKLIDRETGHSSFELVKALRGSFSAFMWQSLASMFGSSLKAEYDPNGEDKLIEIAIRQIEAGEF